MYCQNCGSGLNPQTKYCNRCGTSLAPAGEVKMEKTAAEKRLDEYLDGLFWISVFGSAFIPGHETRELTPPKIEPVMMPAGSVTENTTRSFEPVYRDVSSQRRNDAKEESQL